MYMCVYIYIHTNTYAHQYMATLLMKAWILCYFVMQRAHEETRK